MTQTVPVPARPDAGRVPVLELAGVVKEYPGDPPVVALAAAMDRRIEIRDGRIIRDTPAGR